MLIALAFAFILILESTRRQRKEVLVQDYQYRLFALRDQLRECAIKDQSMAKNWVFQYLDSTIAKSIRLMPRLSIWLMLGLLITYRNDKKIERLGMHLQHEFEKPQNAELRKIEASFTDILSHYIVSRHILMLLISAIVVFLPVRIANAIARLQERSLELIVEAPETSTLGKFAPQAA